MSRCRRPARNKQAQTVTWLATPALPLAHGHDGRAAGRWHCPRYKKGDVTLAGEKFCEILRHISSETDSVTSRKQRSETLQVRFVWINRGLAWMTILTRQ